MFIYLIKKKRGKQDIGLALDQIVNGCTSIIMFIKTKDRISVCTLYQYLEIIIAKERDSIRLSLNRKK